MYGIVCCNRPIITSKDKRKVDGIKIDIDDTKNNIIDNT